MKRFQDSMKVYKGKDCPLQHGGIRYKSNHGCIACLRLHNRKYHKKNKISMNARCRKWAKDNPDKNSKKSIAWALNNQEKARAIRARQYRKNVEKAKQAARQWQLDNPIAVQVYRNQRRARIKGSQGKVTRKQWVDLKGKYQFRCLRCGQQEPDIKLTMDHIVPLVKGGMHVIDNIQPLCWGCNCVKRTKVIDYRVN